MICIQAWVPPAVMVDLLSENKMRRPLGSRLIKDPSTRLRVVPPLCLTPVHVLGGCHLHCSLNIKATGSKVPSPSLIRALAVLIPDTA